MRCRPAGRSSRQINNYLHSGNLAAQTAACGAS